jgi:hypothetical protein
LHPLLECVEPLDGAVLGHYGYVNPNAGPIEPSPDENRFSPGDPNRGQPTTFAAGRHDDVFQVEWGGGDLTWSLTGNAVTASSGSTKCQASITVVKRLVPADDPGRFDLKIDGEIAGTGAAVGNDGTTGTIAVDAGRARTVSESAAAGTSLDDYVVEINCRDDGGTRQLGSGASGPSTSVLVRRGSAIVCTITNTRKQEPGGRMLVPILECVAFSDIGPDVAVWGYRNTGSEPAVVAVGSANRFSPGSIDRGQPEVFEPGRLVGAFQTGFEAGSTPLVWTLTGRTASASASSRSCNATVEVRKVVVPVADLGVFRLRINGTVFATGRAERRLVRCPSAWVRGP